MLLVAAGEKTVPAQDGQQGPGQHLRRGDRQDRLRVPDRPRRPAPARPGQPGRLRSSSTPEGNRLIAHQQRRPDRRRRAARRGPPAQAHGRRQQVRGRRHLARRQGRPDHHPRDLPGPAQLRQGQLPDRRQVDRPAARTRRARSSARRWISRRTSRTTRRTRRSRTSIASCRPSRPRTRRSRRSPTSSTSRSRRPAGLGRSARPRTLPGSPCGGWDATLTGRARAGQPTTAASESSRDWGTRIKVERSGARGFGSSGLTGTHIRAAGRPPARATRRGPGARATRPAGRAPAERIARRLASAAMTGRGPLSAQPGYSLPVFDRLAPAPPPAVVAARIDLHTGARRRRGRPLRPRRLGRPRRGRPPAPGGLARVEPAHPDARRGRPAAARRPPPRRRVPGDGRLAAPRVEPEGVDRRPVRDALRDLRPDARRRRVHLVGRRRGRRRRTGTARSPGTTAARSVATSAAARSSARRRSTPTTCAGPRRTSAPTRCARSLRARFPDRRRRRHRFPTSCSTSTRRASSSASAPSSSGSRATCAPPRSWPRCAWPCSTRSCRRAGSRPARAAPRPCAIVGGHVRPPTGDAVARAQPVARVRGRLPPRPRVRPAPRGRRRSARSRPASARTCAASARGPRRRSSALVRPAGLLALRDDPSAYGRTAPAPRIRLVLGQPPIRPSLERLAAAYHATAWVLGREAAALLPLDALAGAVAPAAVELAGRRDRARARGRRARRWPATAASSCSSTAGPRRSSPRCWAARRPATGCSSARLADPRRGRRGIVELLPPGRARCHPARGRARTSASRRSPGGAGDPDVVPGRGLFAPPERFDQRPFSAAEAARTVTETAVETLRARGEPARYERLLGEILVGLDRAGQLRRLAAADDRRRAARRRRRGGPASRRRSGTRTTTAPDRRPPDPTTGAARRPRRHAGRRRRPTAVGAPPGDRGPAPPRGAGPRREPRSGRAPARPRSATSWPGRRSAASRRSSPGRWWLADPEDLEAAAVPLADRVEWAVFSLLSTAGPISEAAFFERIATLFTGHDLPDEGLVRACLDSYRSLASTPDRLVTGDDLLRRSQEHTELLAHARRRRPPPRACGSGSAAASRPGGSAAGLLGDRLDPREQRAYLGGDQPRRPRSSPRSTASGTSAARSPSCSRSSGRRCSASRSCAATPASRPTTRSSGSSSSPPSGPSSSATSSTARRSCATRSRRATGTSSSRTTCGRSWPATRSTSADLEPYLGLDPLIERSGEQMPLFGG